MDYIKNRTTILERTAAESTGEANISFTGLILLLLAYPSWRLPNFCKCITKGLQSNQ